MHHWVIWRRQAVSRLVGALVLLLVGAQLSPLVLAEPPKTSQDRPNVVLLVVDDLDAKMLEVALPHLPTLAKLRRSGTSFSQFVATTPLCCPSRASILRGQYAHNHGVLQNRGSEEVQGGFLWFNRLERERSTLATWLQDAGYRTALFGKYLNGYPNGAAPTYVPPGWDEWAAHLSEQREAFYFDYRLNENGTPHSYGAAPEDYSTDVLAAKSVAFVEATTDLGQPFFLYIAPYAPHDPAIPAPRHAQAFANAAFPAPSSFDEADVSDKPAWVRDQPRLDDTSRADLDARWRDRLRTLLAVDDLLRTVLSAAEEAGVAEETYVIVASDNGFHFGEHRIRFGKLSPYDESIRVPLLVAGPGVVPAATVDRLVLNTDVAPTIADLAGASIPPFVDGRSFAPLLSGENPAWRSVALVEQFDDAGERAQRAASPRARPDVPVQAGSEHGAGPHATPGAERGRRDRPAGFFNERQAAVPGYRALRGEGFLFVRYDTDELELYDLEADPYQLENLAPATDRAALDSLLTALSELESCAEVACRQLEDAPLDPFGHGE